MREREEGERRHQNFSPFRHSSQSEFVPVTPSSLVTSERGRDGAGHRIIDTATANRVANRLLDIVGPPERSGVFDAEAEAEADRPRSSSGWYLHHIYFSWSYPL